MSMFAPPVCKPVTLRGNRFGQCVSRIGLSMTFASVMPVLRARNAFALLEHIFLEEIEERSPFVGERSGVRKGTWRHWSSQLIEWRVQGFERDRILACGCFLQYGKKCFDNEEIQTPARMNDTGLRG